MKNKFKIDNDVLIIYNRTDHCEIICDATDFDLVSKHTWHLTSHGYALTSITGADGKQKQLHAHRLLMNPPADMDIDHINGIKHDNRRSNLRIVTTSENMQNMRSAKGYYWSKSHGKYRARIVLNKKGIHIGYYKTETEARMAYLDAKKLYHPSSPINQS